MQAFDERSTPAGIDEDVVERALVILEQESRGWVSGRPRRSPTVTAAEPHAGEEP